jgi:hypothetical protein
MPQAKPRLETRRPTHPAFTRSNEHGDRPVDDPPPADHPSENYSAWRASAIYEFVPFSSPGSR